MHDFTTLRPRRNMGAEKWAELERSGITDPGLCPLSVADMEFQTAPEIIDALRAAVEFGVYGYTVANDAYRAAVCSWLERRHQFQTQPEWLVQVFGVVHGINLAVHALTSPGDGVIFQTPAYPPFFHVVNATGRTVLENPLKCEHGRYEMDFEGLEALVKRPEAKLMLLCSPHNPTGRVWKREELERVAQLCADNGVVVFADEIHFDFVFPPHQHTVFASLPAAAQNCVMGCSASKSFNLAGLCTANLVIPSDALRARVSAKNIGYTGEYNGYFGVAATRAAYERGEGWLDELLTVIRGNYEYCKDFLADKFPNVIVSPQEGSYVMWCDFRALGKSSAELETLMTGAGLFFSSGDRFGVRGEGFERINLACPRSCLENAMARLAAAFGRRMDLFA